jgi:hypothetical protein
MKSKIVSFYLGKFRHPGSGLTIEEMWKWDDNRLAGMHGYAVWWFPTKKNATALEWDPITNEDIEEFRANQELRKRLLASFYRMLHFYGLEIDKSTKPPTVRKSENYDERKSIWITPNNQNFRRISRILQCLMLLGFKDAAEIFLAELVEIYFENQRTIGTRTYEFWTLSITDPRYWNGTSDPEPT